MTEAQKAQRRVKVVRHSACHAARAESELKGLVAMFAKILDTDPAYDF